MPKYLQDISNQLILIYSIILLIMIFFYLRIINKGKEKMKQIQMNSRLFNLELIKNFESYIAVLEYHMKKAYDIIYKNGVLIYSMEGMKLNDNEFNKVTKDYLNLVLKLLGPTLQSEFDYLYGNRETFLFNITEYFHNKYESDEVYEAAKNQIMDSENNDESKDNENKNNLDFLNKIL